MDESTVAFALAEGADTFLSSDGKHHLIAQLVAHNVNVILLTHYAAENYGFVRFAENLRNKLKGLPSACSRTSVFCKDDKKEFAMSVLNELLEYQKVDAQLRQN